MGDQALEGALDEIVLALDDLEARLLEPVHRQCVHVGLNRFIGRLETPRRQPAGHGSARLVGQAVAAQVLRLQSEALLQIVLKTGNRLTRDGEDQVEIEVFDPPLPAGSPGSCPGASPFLPFGPRRARRSTPLPSLPLPFQSLAALHVER